MSAAQDFDVAINGKFLSANPTGVHRVAEELICALQAIIHERGAPPFSAEVICPSDIRRSLEDDLIPMRKGGVFTWQFWEQFDLPFLARKRLLVSLCNLAPITVSNAITMIHDAQVYLTPESYSPAFRRWYQFVLPMIGRRHRRILTVSEYSREQLALYNVAPKEKITVIHNGVDHMNKIGSDPSIIDRLGLKKRDYICALANTQRHKNISVLLKAFSENKLASCKLVLFGAADRDAFAQELGVEAPANVVFAGFVTDEEMRSLMEMSLGFACPSTTEGFGLPPLESMLLGAPAIVAPEGALPEVCGEAAIYADAFDPSAWSGAIARLRADEAYWSELSQSGKARAAQFTWRKSAEKLLSVINAELLEMTPAEQPLTASKQMSA